jgi:pimeloyl-ACP methyl ester carboxylesterase
MPEDRSVLGRPAPRPTRSWAYGAGRDRVADVYLPAGSSAHPVLAPVLLVHGGFWRPDYDRFHLRPMAAALAALGHPTVVPEYARSPGRPDEAIADLRDAVAALASQVGTAEPVIVGHSAGGHLALLLAAEPPTPVRGCLALAPVADLVLAEQHDLDGGAARDFLGAPASDRQDLDPARAPRPDVPVTIVHGQQDSLVPMALSESYCATGSARLVVLPQAGHFELIDPLGGAWRTVIGELSALASPAGIE